MIGLLFAPPDAWSPEVCALFAGLFAEFAARALDLDEAEDVEVEFEAPDSLVIAKLTIEGEPATEEQWAELEACGLVKPAPAKRPPAQGEAA